MSEHFKKLYFKEVHEKFIADIKLAQVHEILCPLYNCVLDPAEVISQHFGRNLIYVVRQALLVLHDGKEAEVSSDENEQLSKLKEELPYRAWSRLVDAGITSLEALTYCREADLLKIPGFGRISLMVTRDVLAREDIGCLWANAEIHPELQEILGDRASLIE